MPSLSPLPQRFHPDGRECICRRCRRANDRTHWTARGLREFLGVEPQYRGPVPVTPVTLVPSWETDRYYHTTDELRDLAGLDEWLPQPVSSGQNDWRVVSTPLSYESFNEEIQRTQVDPGWQRLYLEPESVLRTNDGEWYRVNPVEEWNTGYMGTTSLGDYDGDRRDTTSTTNQSDGTSEGEEERDRYAAYSRTRDQFPL